MCNVSKNLKLCTCSIVDIEKLDNFWILYNYKKSQIIMIGEPMLLQEFEIEEGVDKSNFETLAKMLNADNCFDVELEIKNKAILEINFGCKIKNREKKKVNLVYEFIFKNGKWIANGYDPFNANKLQIQQDKILNPFQKKLNA